MLNIQTASLDILLQKVLGIQRAIIFGLIFTMCLSSFKFANAQESDTSLSGYLFTERTLDAAVKVRAHELEIDGVSVSTLDENGQTYTAYFGEGVNKNAVFQAASMSKPVTAVGVLLLAHERGINLDADIRSHITSLDWTKIKGGHTPVSLRQLLSVRRHIICPRFRPGLRETLLIMWFDIRRQLCGIASVGVR